MYKFHIVDKVAIILVIFGAINCGLKGILSSDLIELLLSKPDGSISILAQIVYILIGAAGVALIMLLAKMTQASRFK